MQAKKKAEIKQRKAEIQAKMAEIKTEYWHLGLKRLSSGEMVGIQEKQADI
jgi:hypothetical protein